MPRFLKFVFLLRFPLLSAIALAASESLYAVGMIVFETMRSMGSQIADETDFKAA